MARRPSPKMNEEQLKTWILRKLGAPQVKIELTPADLEDFIEDTKDWFIAKKGIVRHQTMAVIASQPGYEVADDVDEILDVVFPAPPFDLGVVFSPYILADEKIPYDVFAAPDSGGLYSSLVQAIQYSESARRVLSAEDLWQWFPEERKIVLSPVPRNSGIMVIEFTSNSVVFDQLDREDYVYFQKYALALAKDKLGRVRGKYSQFPGAQGDRDMDGRELREEAKAEIEALDEQIRLSGYPLLFLTG